MPCRAGATVPCVQDRLLACRLVGNANQNPRPSRRGCSAANGLLRACVPTLPFSFISSHHVIMFSMENNGSQLEWSQQKHDDTGFLLVSMPSAPRRAKTRQHSSTLTCHPTCRRTPHVTLIPRASHQPACTLPTCFPWREWSALQRCRDSRRCRVRVGSCTSRRRQAQPWSCHPPS